MKPLKYAIIIEDGEYTTAYLWEHGKCTDYTDRRKRTTDKDAMMKNVWALWGADTPVIVHP